MIGDSLKLSRTPHEMMSCKRKASDYIDLYRLSVPCSDWKNYRIVYLAKKTIAPLIV